MFITNLLLKKAKSKDVMVLLESVVSGHQVTKIRERLGDKIELIRFDPYKNVLVSRTPPCSQYVKECGRCFALMESIFCISCIDERSKQKIKPTTLCNTGF